MSAERGRGGENNALTLLQQFLSFIISHFHPAASCKIRSKSASEVACHSI